MARRQDVLLTDEQWERIKPFIPQPLTPLRAANELLADGFISEVVRFERTNV